MIDEKRLERLLSAAQQGFAIAPPEMAEILRLARLGLWAEKHGIPATRSAVEWFRALRDHQDPLLSQGLDKACENWDEATGFEPIDFQPLINSLSALPKPDPQPSDHTPPDDSP